MLVGYENSEDAGVYRISEDQALVTTADFITPPVDDPFMFGQIAAANAISDVYAMGGKPLTCLNLVSFPPDKLAPEILHKIIEGALAKITEAGAVLAGGHSVENDEPKFGLAVTGIVHPDKYWSNSAAKPGDVLILTKAIGTGVLLNANLKNMVSEPAIKKCLESMMTLNKAAAEVMSNYEIHSVTDVTGFGLAGHGFEMAKGSGVSLKFSLDKVPILDQALEMYSKKVSTGVNDQNQLLTHGQVKFIVDLPDWHKEIVYDPQTSGGLLVSLQEKEAERLLKELHDQGVEAASIIGEVKPLQNSDYVVFY